VLFALDKFERLKLRDAIKSLVRQFITSVILLFVLSSVGSVVTSNTAVGSSYQLIWSDEFDGDHIDTNNWNFEIGGSGWGNNELEYYTSREENARIEDGNLIIEAREEPYGGNDYTSARLTTQGKEEFQYGKIEARMKLPMGQGLWPAFWMLGSDIGTVGWPGCGEIDIMEHINSEDKVYGTIHWDYNGHASYGNSIAVDPTAYNTYSIIWDEQTIRWYVNDFQYLEANITINDTEEFHHPFFIILNLAVGGNWPGYPEASTQFPARVYVDWVRVYAAE